MSPVEQTRIVQRPPERRGHSCDASTLQPDPLTRRPVGYVCVLRAHHHGPVHRGFAFDGSQMEWYDMRWWRRHRRDVLIYAAMIAVVYGFTLLQEQMGWLP